MFNSLARTKDVLKKLVFALEQESLSTRDSLVTKMIEKTRPSTVVNDYDFESNFIDNRRSSSKDKAKNIDFLFVKRLMYIKLFIDQLSINEEENDDDFSAKPHTSKSLLVARKSINKPLKLDEKLTSYGSVITSKPRASTTIHKKRRHETQSMSPLRLFEQNKDRGLEKKIDLK